MNLGGVACLPCHHDVLTPTGAFPHSPQAEIGKGSFQELDQMAAVQQYTKLATQASSPEDVPCALADAFQAATRGRPGATYVDIPSDVLMAQAASVEAAGAALAAVPAAPARERLEASAPDVAAAVKLLQSAKR